MSYRWMGRFGVAAAVLSVAALPAPATAAASSKFTKEFLFDECDGFSDNGRNPYFVLEPGAELRFEGQDGKEEMELTITVLNETEEVDGVETRVVEEEEKVDGELVEISRNFFAICNRDNSVVYFGEDVDIYEDGEVVSHDGAWRAGQDGAKPGIMMPGTPLVGARYFQELAPGVAMDRAEITSVTATIETPAATFDGCLKTVETTPLEGGKSLKTYAPGIGLVKDGPVVLVDYDV